LQIIANVVRYHRGGLPAESHIAFIALQREARNVVMKLAAILRVADALDKSHDGRIKHITVEKKPETLLILPMSKHGIALDCSIERIGLEEKGDLFQEVFGLKVLI
jgi:exopolyphosphatase/guanosine-5'-triphosphate,3'-diphosphate pyrophosphatase